MEFNSNITYCLGFRYSESQHCLLTNVTKNHYSINKKYQCQHNLRSLIQDKNYTKYTYKITTILKRENTYVKFECSDEFNVQTKDKTFAAIAP